MSDRLQQLAIFVRTVETGSFSKAAREFGMTQPSVSRTIAALEERLGVKLVTRTTRQLALTDAGEALLARAREALTSVDDAENAARGADRLTGTLRVALSTPFGTRQIVPLLPGFLERQPELSVELLMSDRYENLIAEGADLALRLGEQPASGFVTRKLASTRRLFIASPSYVARRGTPTTLAEFARHDLVGRDSDGPSWSATRGGRTEIQPVAPRVRTNSAAAVVACVAAGLGIGMASFWMCADELASNRVVELLGEYRLEPVTAYVVFPGGRRPSQKARAFADYLQQALMRG
jgi:DNA-binding transcriptional LysR family regulator